VVKSPFNDFNLATTPTHFMQTTRHPKNAVFIEKLLVKPTDQRQIPLGSFTEENAPKGFLVEVDPDPTPVNSVVTEVTSMGGHNRYTLFLHVANHGTKPAHVEVWRL
jgi:hypothetical protein